MRRAAALSATVLLGLGLAAAPAPAASAAGCLFGIFGSDCIAQEGQRHDWVREAPAARSCWWIICAERRLSEPGPVTNDRGGWWSDPVGEPDANDGGVVPGTDGGCGEIFGAPIEEC